MNFIFYPSVILVLIGALFLSLSIARSRRLRTLIPAGLRRKWTFLTCLTTFFLAGYLLYASTLILDLTFPLKLITGLVFFGGSVFVFLVVDLSRHTIQTINATQQEVAETNDLLAVKNRELAAEVERRKQIGEKLRTYQSSLENLVDQRTEHLQTLLNFSRKLTSTVDLQSLYQEVTVRSRSLLQFDFSTILTLTEDRRSLVIQDTIGFSDSPPDCFSMTGGRGLPAYVVQTKKPVAVENFSSEERFPISPIIREHGIHSALCVPMMIGDEIVGVLIGHNYNRRTFTEEEISLYNSFADQAGMAIKNTIQMVSLKESERKFRTIFDNASDAIFIFDRDGRMLEVNNIASNRLGYSYEELLNMTPDRFVDPDYTHGVKEILNRILEADELTLLESAHVRKDGTKFPVELSGRLIHFKGKPAVLVIARDISERKNMEGQLRQAQKMEAMGTLAGGIAHDFNNILHAIQGYAELSLIDLPRDSQFYENLMEIDKYSKRAADLVKQILTFSRKNEQEKKQLDLSEITAETLNFLRDIIPASIDLRQEIPEDNPPVLADPTQIQQVIINLCTNAVDAMNESGGILLIRLQPLKIKAPDLPHPDLLPGSYTLLSVEDNGHGMDNHIRERIFEPYFTTKGLGRGTGLGLATVHGIVESHQGTIVVDSRPERGTRFDIYFPSAAPAAAGEDDEDQNSSSLPVIAGNVLLIDDEDSIVTMAGKALEKSGCKVYAFTRSIEALDFFQRNSVIFDVVVTDQTMPNLSGKELARAILTRRPGLPVILITGYSDHINEETARQTGIQEFLMKPLKIDKLVNAVHRAVTTSTPAFRK